MEPPSPITRHPVRHTLVVYEQHRHRSAPQPLAKKAGASDGPRRGHPKRPPHLRDAKRGAAKLLSHYTTSRAFVNTATATYLRRPPLPLRLSFGGIRLLRMHWLAEDFSDLWFFGAGARLQQVSVLQRQFPTEQPGYRRDHRQAAQSNPLSLPFYILYASENRGMHEGREYHEIGCTGILEAG